MLRKTLRNMFLIGLMLWGTGCTPSNKLSDEHRTIEVLRKRHVPDDDALASILWRIAGSEMDVDLQVQSTLKQLWQFGAVHLALKRFHHDVGRYPSTSEGLHALIAPPTTLTPSEIPTWAGPYTENDDLQDGWGRELKYCFPALTNDPKLKSKPQIEGNKLFLRPNARIQVSVDRTKIYTFPASVDLWSIGADGIDGTPDDLGNWNCYLPLASWRLSEL